MNIRELLQSLTGRAWLRGGSLALCAAALMSALDPAQTKWLSFLGYSLLLLAALSGLEAGQHHWQASSAVRWITFAAFWLRLGVGVCLTLALPVFGYADSEPSQAGYLYQDAYTRDTSAWQLSQSDAPLSDAFSGSYAGDQYGGMLAFSAWLYRWLSWDMHRPWLVLIGVAFAGAWGALVLWAAIQRWLSDQNEPGTGIDSHKIAILGAGIFAFYPEAVFLGSTTMRESFILAFSCMLFYSFVLLLRRQFAWLVWFGLSLVGLLLVQPPMALVMLGVVSVIWLLDPQRKLSWQILAGLGLALGLALVSVIASWRELPGLTGYQPQDVIFSWLNMNFGFQAHLSERASGMLQKLLETAGERWSIPLILGYGAAQPVLPATLVDPAAVIWRVVNTLRALGWYILAPLLLYGMLTSFHPGSQVRRWTRIFLGLACMLWIGIAAANAGGDLWDNPRYRVLFLPWMALFAAWAWEWRRIRRDPWLWRWLFIMALFVTLFLEWYISRYYPTLLHLSIWSMIGLTLAAGVAILAGSLIWDWVKSRT